MRKNLSALVLALAANLDLTTAALFTNPADLQNKNYDYVVVGAGPGGSPVASRLSEDPKVKVLLIEAGPNDEGVLDIEVPYLAFNLQPNTLYDWNYTTIPQTGLGGRPISYTRGHVLGGSSSINIMAWTRGSIDDFDRYATVSGDHGWSWDAIKPYFKKLERFVPPVDHHNTSGQIEAWIHGTNGPVNITVNNTPFPIDSHIVNTTQELSQDYPFNHDQNSGRPLGIGWAQTTTGNGKRSSASSSYIRPFLDRSNLDVLVNTVATKLLKTGHDEGTGLPIFSSVVVAQSSTSPNYTFCAAKEVILSAGAVNTPQLLMLSGIGPASQLSSLGIKVIVDSPSVGQNLSDHPGVGNQYEVANASDDVVDTLQRNNTLLDEYLREWNETRQGPMTANSFNHIGWLRLSNDDPIWQSEPDPSAGPTSAQYEYLLDDGFVAATPPATGNFITIDTVLVSPTSRGNITLNSTSPFDAPLINPAFLETALDVYIMRTAIRSTAHFLSAKTWEGFVTGPGGDFANVDLSSDEQVDAWAREQAATVWHPTGTAQMGSCKDLQSVVDPDLRVKGTKGLRIVDASVFPYIPAAHPQAVVYAFAERAADLIKQGRQYC